jgi:hypothetical protein
MRNAESFEALFASVKVCAPIRDHVNFGAGRGVLNEIFLGLAVRTIANADVFPTGIHALALGKAGATAE